MKRYLVDATEFGLFLIIYLFPVRSFAQGTVEQVLQFEHTVINIGTLSEDDVPATYHFKYHNISKKPVYLSEITTSCGCTVAQCNKKVVQPGEQGEIILVFHPMDQAGDLYREAFVYTNLSKKHPIAKLALIGKVLPTADRWREYPVSIGNVLRLKRKDWNVRIFSREGRQVERFVCVNIGKQPLRLSALLLPEYIHFRTEPEIISPGTEADMILSIDKGLLPQEGEIEFHFILDGIPVRPSERRIQVKLLLQ